jgi:hypothetical protein
MFICRLQCQVTFAPPCTCKVLGCHSNEVPYCGRLCYDAVCSGRCAATCNMNILRHVGPLIWGQYLLPKFCQTHPPDYTMLPPNYMDIICRMCHVSCSFSVFSLAGVMLGIYLLTYVLTPWSRVLLEKLTGLQLVKKFPTFYGTQRFITAFISARHLSLS